VPVAHGGELYEEIGRSYSATRREDPRIAAHILSAIGGAKAVLNLGAGTGNYEPADGLVVAVEPSLEMIGQRRGRSPLVVRAVAESLPLRDDVFDVGMAVLTLHHWTDVPRGLRELRRVSRRQVVFFFEPLHTRDFWALAYFPDSATIASERHAPGEEELRGSLDVHEIQVVPVPADCTDGFGAAFWARPEAYTDPVVQAGMSWLALLPDDVRARGADRLNRDLASGEWDRRYGHLRHLSEFDGGYRIAIAGD
jgi:SAM-dependent methyltransferase